MNASNRSSHRSGTPFHLNQRIPWHLTTLLLGAVLGALPMRADETCMSPYMAKITGQEEYVYVWTLGIEGLGDGSDKLVTVDAKPGSPNYGKVINLSLIHI